MFKKNKKQTETIKESEIANLQKITQSGVFRNRHHALETMKKILKEKQ